MYVGKVKLKKVPFIIWWICVKAKKYWAQIHVIMQVFKNNIKLKSEVFLIELFDMELDKIFGTLLLYKSTTTRILYTQKWKDISIPKTED